MSKVYNIFEIIKNEKVEWRKLGEVCKDKFWIMPTTPNFVDNGIPYITGKNIKNGIIDFNNIKYISEVDYRLIARNRSIEIGDMLISMIGTIGEIGIVKDERKFYGQNLYLLRLNNSIILNRYFYYYFTQPSIKNGLISKKNSSSQGYIKAGQLENISIPIPSLETQQKIVEILDKFTNYVTELKVELQQRTKQYEYNRNLLLSEEYLNKLSEKIFMQSNNIVKKFKLIEIVELNRGKRVVKSELAENAKYPVFQNSLTPLGYYDYKNFDGGKTCIITAGAAGEIFYQDKDFWAADDVFVLTTNNILNKYLYYFLLNKQCLLKSKVRKASIPRLSRDDIEKIEISLPPIHIQNKVVQILDKFQSLLSDTKGLLPEEIKQRQKQYEYYREKLLTFSDVYASTHAR